MPDPPEAQAPIIIVIWACPKCGTQNRSPFGAEKNECKNCYQRVIVDLVSTDFEGQALRMAGR